MSEEEYGRLLNLCRYYFLNIDMVDRYRPRRFAFSFRGCPIPEDVQQEILNAPDNYTRNLLLKERLAEFMDGLPNNPELNFWIIRKWGGINPFRETPDNHIWIFNTYQRLVDNHETPNQRIASFSKVASFASPHDYFVYDARVAFSLNWLLRSSGINEGFFPIPDGQNSRISACDLKGVLSNNNPAAIRNDLLSYYDYCQLINRLYYDLEPQGNQPYKLEMLLFQIAPDEIVEAFRNEFQNTRFYQERPRQQANRDLVPTVIAQGEKILNRTGRTVCGRKIPKDGKDYYVFVGEDSKKAYCEVITSDGQYSNAMRDLILEDPCFVYKTQIRKPYFIREYDLNDIPEATDKMEALTEELIRILKEEMIQRH